MNETDIKSLKAGVAAQTNSIFIDVNNEKVVIPAAFKVSPREDEQIKAQGLVIIGPDGSEFVWIPCDVTELAIRDFGVYFYGEDIAYYHDETQLSEYQQMLASVKKYQGFYLGRYETSCVSADDSRKAVPASKKVNSQGRIWVRISPQDAAIVAHELYADNESVECFFPWGINYDTALKWLADSGSLRMADIVDDSSSWGHYADSAFCSSLSARTTGEWRQAMVNNICDLAGNNWEWTRERCGSSYVMRGGGSSLMGGPCYGSHAPAGIRDPLPGTSHHPNVTFRLALYIR